MTDMPLLFVCSVLMHLLDIKIRFIFNFGKITNCRAIYRNWLQLKHVSNDSDITRWIKYCVIIAFDILLINLMFCCCFLFVIKQ